MLRELKHSEQQVTAVRWKIISCMDASTCRQHRQRSISQFDMSKAKALWERHPCLNPIQNSSPMWTTHVGENTRFLQQLLQHSSQSLDSLSSTTAGTLHGLVWLERLIPQPYIHLTATIQRPVRLEDWTHLPNSNPRIRSPLEKHHYMGRLPCQRYTVLKNNQGLELLQACLTPAQKESIRTHSTMVTKMLVLCPKIKFLPTNQPTFSNANILPGNSTTTSCHLFINFT